MLSLVQILFGMESGNKTRQHLLHFMGNLVHIDTTVGGHLRVVTVPALQGQQKQSPAPIQPLTRKNKQSRALEGIIK